MNEKELREKIFELAKEYYINFHKPKLEKEFNNEHDKISYAGRVYDEKEIINLIDASLEFWLTGGRYTQQFESSLAKFLDVKYALLVNSGSSANLLAFMALTSPKLGNRRILPGDEVITVAAGFPTTVSPIIQYGAIPVFVDIDIPTYNISISNLEKAITSKTKAIIIAHTLGNPFNIAKIKELCNKYNLWLIEDNCDALGAKYFYNGKYQYTGTFGDIGTSSFYPAHHITTGEGGAVYTNNYELYRILLSLRDWGRDCWCAPGKDNSCGKRFSWKLGELPEGYDHKYIYSHFGYNLKATEMQAAIGVAQLKKLPLFIEKRNENWSYLRNKLKNLEDKIILPEATENSIPSWFGFMITLKENDKYNRNELVYFLENNRIQTRLLFAGNLLKQPCFDDLRKTNKYRVFGDLKNTDYVLNNSFWLGVYPGLRKEHLDYIIEKIYEYFEK